MKTFSSKRRNFSGTTWLKCLVVASFLCIQTVVASASVYSDEKPITLKMKNVPISEVFQAIKNQSEFSIVYNNQDIDVNKKVSVDITNGKINTILDQILKGQNVDYQIDDKHIVLAAKAPVKQIVIKGIVTDEKGETIVGANVLEAGTTNGASTDIDGKFTLTVNSNSNLLVSFIGYQMQTIPVNGKTYFTIKLKEESEMLDAVVVTAMGIKKKASSLTYSTQQVGGDELTRAKDANMINSLSGKTAGVQISRNSSGLGGSAKVIIRGNRSAAGNNQPLYVIDGVPMLNSTNEQAVTVTGGTADAGNRDGGDGISNLNPDDIESMSILKGASAAALYGSSAANGVILITTKKGHSGIQSVQFSSNLTIDHAYDLPEFQNNYGISGNAMSWGTKNASKNYDVKDFFQNGITAINSISFTSGNDKMQTYFSYANTSARGVLEKNKLQKHNFNFRETAKFFNDHLTLDANINLISQSIDNRQTSGGLYMNPLIGLYRFPRGMDITQYKDNFEVYNIDRNLNAQNWYYTDGTGFEQNPWWLLYRTPSKDKRNRVIAGINASVKVTDWLTIQARGNADYIHDKYNQKFYATTSEAISSPNGRYVDLNYEEKQYYGDLMAMINKSWGNFSLNAAVGASVNDHHVSSLRLDSRTAGLYYANIFTIANIKMAPGAFIEEQQDAHKQMQAVFGTAQVGFKESIYLDVTARNEWSSTLAFTPSATEGYFYPSVGLSWIIDKMVDLPSWINFGKVRGSWSKVGNDIPLFISNSVDHISAGGATQPVDAAPFDNMKPEMNTSIEFGTEWKFFNYRLDFDFTFYKTNTKDQFFRLPTVAGDRYKYRYVNAGNIENKGVEITLGVTPVISDNFRWKTSFNFATNKNKVKKLHPELKNFEFATAGNYSYQMKLVEGGSFGDIYGKGFARDAQGHIQYGTDGMPLPTDAYNDTYIGNASPDFNLSWINTLSYKGFTLNFLIDGRFGGDVLSLTQADLDLSGVSKETGAARDRGYVNFDGRQLDPTKFYATVGGMGGISEYYMYDATNIRMREISLGYQFPKRWMDKTGFIKDAQLSFIGRNLFFFYKDAPFDPDASLSTGNNNQGVDMYGMPTTRSLGFNLKLTF